MSNPFEGTGVMATPKKITPFCPSFPVDHPINIRAGNSMGLIFNPRKKVWLDQNGNQAYPEPDDLY